ncbi:ATPase [Actinoplanes sp. SE50]|uniref:helix-turn-helix transcriptional regulator n=1 Tax=unclassified Actinoplanes TaxID=2626549 RepID=UPI00023EC3CF|nr:MULTISPECIES: AAA family ATPase [unclassified Actinoplanes]AEV81892.1 LuxR family transcriptional regulator [Actinoplanes sp. SE50/110]ATO80293.1 ATPase [Actinoplanes sp. SE50]SLL97698.1 ATPase [Actinoplanes sp. SE50/110]
MELVERDGVMAVLDSLLAAAVAGKGRVAMVTGSVATGKTELLNTFAERVVDLNGLAITAVGARSERDLPLGVFGQLLMDAPLVAEDSRRAMDLLHEGAQSIPAGPDGAARLDPQIVHALCTILLDLSQRYPLVVVVDDIDQADPASLLCLSYLARRVRFAPMLAVFSLSSYARPDEPAVELEALSRPPQGAHLSVAALSPEGVRRMAAEVLDPEQADRIAPRWHQLTGGNPLLVTGLVADHRQVLAEGGAADGEPVTAGHYARAVVSCLHRIDPQLAEVARGAAILPETGLLDQLLGVDAAHIGQALRALTTAGVLHNGEYRHPVAREAVLAEIPDTERREMHRRAAVLAHYGGAATRVVADQLLGAGRADDPWAVPVLEEAARQGLREGRVDTAIGYLRLAWQTCADGPHRAKIMTTMLRAAWRINPGTSTAYLPELTAALQRGFLLGGDALALTKALLWDGQFSSARTVFDHLNAVTDDLDQEGMTELAIARPLLRCTYPPFFALLRQPSERPPAVSTVAASHRLEAATALATVLTRGPSEKIATAVQRILHNSRLDEMSLDTVESALLTLTYGGWCDQAASWCDLFVEEAVTRRAPSRLARLSAIRAEVSLRLGDLPAAVRHARFALDTMPPASWGVAIGAAVAPMMLAATAMGRYDLVREQLDQPVPEEMFHTRYGLHYLQARGRYSMAIGQLQLALRDFELCGELAGKWHLDVPGLVPWRVDMAEALLLAGLPDRAHELIEDQLNRCAKNNPRVQGMAMRLYAATSQPRHRPMFLRQSVDLQAGDEYEQARALVDLTGAYEAVGESRRAGMIARRARALADKTEAEPLLATLSPELGGDEAETATALNLAAGAVTLSDAERRVAILAADGYTNREIATKLYITVSTVEQHLTRVYRKLDVHRRTDLPAHLLRDHATAN